MAMIPPWFEMTAFCLQASSPRLYGADRHYRDMAQKRRPMVAKPEDEIRRLQMKVGVKWPAKLDRWRGKQPVPPNRSDAIRQPVERAIDADCSTSGKKKR